MAKGSFRSSDYLFPEGTLSAALREAGVTSNMHTLRTPKFTVNGKMIHAPREKVA